MNISNLAIVFSILASLLLMFSALSNVYLQYRLGFENPLIPWKLWNGVNSLDTYVNQTEEKA